MAVMCKYFQQGRCRFGNQCKFQHYDDGGAGRVNDQYHYYKPEKPDINAILQAVQQEIVASEKGNQWPLSCFAPLKEFGNVIGWEDISPEELRWQTYLSRQSGNLDEWLKQVQELYQKATRNKALMLNPTMETYSVLESIFKKDSISSFSFGGQVQTQAQTAFSPGAFGATNSSFSSAPQGQAATNIFGGSSAGFSAPANTSQNAFNTVALGHSTNIFGGGGSSTGAMTAPLFGASTSGPALFGNTQTAFSRNIFGNAQPTSSTSVFSNAASTAPTPATNIFGNASNPTPSSTNMFGAVAHTSSIFGGQQQSQPPVQGFGGQTFGEPQQQSFPFQSTGSSIFGNTSELGSKQHAALAGDDSYTPMSDLSEDVLALFKSDKYEMGKIPIVPPPKELCS